ncbi:hypothetical protein E2C01_085521 [Portunus trituberculatus]|uniref:Uncharacterized protein n=1 Tax=Portunus trituberculatus TaxID=210409 RepID=A0A5B7J181_PORTR|nr:hypothetical protein [Portunus trituberculatus]
MTRLRFLIRTLQVKGGAVVSLLHHASLSPSLPPAGGREGECGGGGDSLFVSGPQREVTFDSLTQRTSCGSSAGLREEQLLSRKEGDRKGEREGGMTRRRETEKEREGHGGRERL